MTRRRPRRVRWLLYGTLGLYGFYWILVTARELKGQGVQGAPSRGQWLAWCVLFGLTPGIGLVAFLNLWLTTADAAFALTVTGYILGLPFLGILHAVLSTRRAIHDYLDVSPSLRRAFLEGPGRLRCPIVHWQERLNERDEKEPYSS